MEKESFEDDEIADILNRHFVAVKVDREERPDIDSIYMKACMMISGHGGWPLTVFLTPEKEPFFAGTYFPRESRYGRIGLKYLLLRIAELWKTDRESLLQTSRIVVENLKKESQVSGVLDGEVMEKSYKRLREIFDPVHGGFGHKPKFPSPHNFLFLLRYHHRTGKKDALFMVEHSLKKMRLGGMFDHVGFGFHRYSTDERWLLPHFEKMLYDQAMFSMAYAEAYQLTKDEFYREVLEEILEYVTREMLSEEGGFYSAEDADSEGEEGKFYFWRYSEMEEILGDDILFAERVFNVRREGNYRGEATGRVRGDNILYMEKTYKEIAEELGVGEEELRRRMERIRRKLFEVRERRVHPLKDTKILADWNGLMIAALSMASQVTGREGYAIMAKRCADFVLSKMVVDGGLMHRYMDGEMKFYGNLDDYAFLVWGLVELYQTIFEEFYMEKAVELTDKMIKHFWDGRNGGFFMTPDYAEENIVRTKEWYDGAIPSGNSVAAYNLFRLYKVTGKEDYLNYGKETLETFAGGMAEIPNTMLLIAYDFYLSGDVEIVIAGEEGTEEFLKVLNNFYLPYKTVLLKKNDEISKIAPFTKFIPIESSAKAYVCKNFACQLPANSPEEFERVLRGD